MNPSRTRQVLLFGLFLLLAASVSWSQQAPTGPVTMKGPSMPPVIFPHSAHTRVAGKCEICHHASKPEKPLNPPQQPCLDCHTKPPTPPVSTGLPTAFHNAGATAGICITCHKTENEQGKSAPARCPECHKPDKSAG
jgi:hypothetical protein